MFRKKSLFATAASMVFSVLAISGAKAQDTGCYTLASLQGNYALIGDYGANVAIALSTRNFDGNGNLTAKFTVNEPTAGSTTGDRTIVTGAQTGTYTVNCDGTGLITTALTTSTGVTATQMYDFIVTGAIVQGGQLLATSLVDAQRTPSAIVSGGIFLSRSYTRLPDAGCYTLGSLRGNYALIGDYGANVAIALSTRNFDGNGNVTASFIVNEPTAGSTTGGRTIVTGMQTGTYTLNCDGTGVITTALTTSTGTAATQMYDFIVTGASVQGGQPIATSMVDAQRTPSAIVPGGIFLTRTYTLRPTLPAQQTQAIASPKNVSVTSSEIQLDGSQSTSADGKALTYLWTIPPGSPSAAILHGTTATPIVQFGQGSATYAFQLTVTDSAGKSSTDVATVSYYGN